MAGLILLLDILEIFEALEGRGINQVYVYLPYTIPRGVNEGKHRIF